MSVSAKKEFDSEPLSNTPSPFLSREFYLECIKITVEKVSMLFIILDKNVYFKWTHPLVMSNSMEYNVYITAGFEPVASVFNSPNGFSNHATISYYLFLSTDTFFSMKM